MVTRRECRATPALIPRSRRDVAYLDASGRVSLVVEASGRGAVVDPSATLDAYSRSGDRPHRGANVKRGRMDGEGEFDSFVAGRAPSLQRTAYLMTADWHLAEDLVQTALAKLYLARHRVELAGAEAYTRRVITNLYIDRGRRASHREQPVAAVPDTGSVPLEWSGDRMVLLAALRSLPRTQRVVLVLRYWEDLSIEQVAALLDVPVGTVKSQTSRGLEALRGSLGIEVDTREAPLQAERPEGGAAS
jgi:RNA polymerase sigma-70 factor (sigma-E family)